MMSASTAHDAGLGDDRGVLRVTDGTLTLDDMLRFVAAARHSGVLHVQGERSGSFELDAGRVVDAHVDDGPDVHDLVRRRVGDAGADPSAVGAALLEHAVDVLLELEIAASGETTMLEFVDDASHDPSFAMPVTVDDVLAGKQGRVREWKEIAAAMPPAGAVLRLAADLPPGGVTVDPDDWRVLDALRGGGTVAHVARVARIGAFSACRSLLRLLATGAVSIMAPTDSEPGELHASPSLVSDKGTS